jgi:hypothetical protein|tara:strand:+ start:1466 stop:1696 length:231 start_codon:yes stop_codon:yes gene_type:complete
MPKKDQEAAPNVIRSEKLVTPSKPSPLVLESSENPYENKKGLYGAPTTAQPASRPDSGNVLRSKSLAQNLAKNIKP